MLEHYSGSLNCKHVLSTISEESIVVQPKKHLQSLVHSHPICMLGSLLGQVLASQSDYYPILHLVIRAVGCSQVKPSCRCKKRDMEYDRRPRRDRSFSTFTGLVATPRASHQVN